MEEVAMTADAYYARLPPAQQQIALDIFRSMDINGDGNITFNEYSNYCSTRGTQQPERRFFDLFDKDRNGSLNFREFLSLHYLSSANMIFTCNGCRVFLTGVYFTCSQCFHTPRTYDLCPNCYKENYFVHPHSADAFLDNYTMLHLNRRKVLEIQQQHQFAPHNHHHCHHYYYPQHHHVHQGNDVGVGDIIQALAFGYQATSLCNMM